MKVSQLSRIAGCTFLMSIAPVELVAYYLDEYMCVLKDVLLVKIQSIRYIRYILVNELN